MTIADPVVARRERRRRLEGRPAVLALIVVAVVVAMGCAVALGIMIGATVEDIRHSIIDSVFDERESEPTFWGPATTAILWILGTFGLLGSAAAASWSLDAYRGGERTPVVLVPALSAIVVAVVAIDATGWLEPLRVGTRVDPVFHHDVPWDAGSWVAYTADLWLPVLLILAVAGGIVVVAVHNRRLLEQRRLRTRLLREGRRVPGTIVGTTARTATNDVGQRSVIGATVDVRYTDHAGVGHRLSRSIRRRDVLAGGFSVEVLYDPARPGDDDAVFLAFDRDPDPSEWVGAVD
ncbi:hypothetical protein ESP57_12995 [Agromyces fucosus]|uniref:DUF3592 domain-containing protein n=1 Tax=Agromyces fucosus TaxID=41985 RepID=A0A4Q2JLJ4_9MICO|nr:DUF3592 domain-containing protein [Agromyces fucosus]RXZ47469.1 hypothetical protein ESP57_12995 [Agromyces fucosus]